jgi:stearoyl-CoA desaturase (delta-9 desaturase)
MNAAPLAHPRPSRAPLLLECQLSVAGEAGRLRIPSRREVLTAWLDGIDVIHHRDRWLNLLSLVFQAAAGVIFLHHLIAFATLTTLLFMAGAVMFLGVVYNTFWYHRYCSHKAFRFRSVACARVFLWSNPLVMREEVYALPHRVHHRCADGPGDPYGPHMGWLGAFLAQDSTFRINRALGAADYRRCRESMRHVGMVSNDHACFLRTGSIEAVGWYAARTLFAQSFWGVLVWSIGGVPLLTAWYGAIFVIWCMVRDFQWRGHGGAGRRWRRPGFGKRRGWEFDSSCAALNQRFYGYFVAEWHDNHHLYPASANLAFLDGQLDLAFLLVRALHRLGIVSSYFDAKPKFDTAHRGRTRG